MTRDEAMRAVDGVVTAPWESATSTLVRRLEALGVIKIENPLTETERLCAALSWGEHSSRIFNETLSELGLKVVRAC